MKTRLIVGMICLVFLTWCFVIAGPPSANATTKGVDEIEFLEAFKGGLIRITLAARDDGHKVEVDIKRRIPMIIIIPRGRTRLGDDGSPELVSETNIHLDLTTKLQGQVILTQSGSHRILSGKQSMEACYNGTTGKILKRLKSGRQLLFDLVIAALSEEERYKRKLGANALGEAGDTQALPDLKRLAESDPDIDVRSAAKEAITQIQSVSQ